MKKTILIFSILSVSCFIIIYFLVFKNDQITINEAYKIALKETGKKENEINSRILKEDKENNFYEITFKDEMYSYQVKIDSKSGKIIEQKTDEIIEHEEVLKYISEEEAKKIALEEAELTEKDVGNISVKLYKKNNIIIYNVIYYAKRYLYDCEINAVTGEFVNTKIERD